MEKRLLFCAFLFAVAACAPVKQIDEASTDDNQTMDEPNNPGGGETPTTPGDNAGTPPVNPNPSNPGAPSNPSNPPETAPTTKLVTLAEAYNVRTLKSGVLESVDYLDTGIEVEVATGGTVNYPYRNDAGNQTFSSTGFLPVVSFKRIPAGAHLTSARAAELLKLTGGLYVSALAGQVSGGGTGATIPALTAKTPGAGFQKYFSENGKPKVSYKSSMTKRFGSLLNRGVTLDQLSASERTKWSKIMAEMQKAVDRTKPAQKSLIFIDNALGRSLSLDFEKKKTVSPEGAWTIAVEGTAKRLGFANVPCAEFVSEVIREAYVRAGYSHFDDFTDARGNRLDYYNGAAAVVNLTDFLAKAGWIPWDPSEYVPPVGAPMMHATAKTPGHAYLSAGENGRFIVDNGTPEGRDLRGSTENTISIMFQHGVFFLPPGFIPQKW